MNAVYERISVQAVVGRYKLNPKHWDSSSVNREVDFHYHLKLSDIRINAIHEYRNLLPIV